MKLPAKGIQVNKDTLKKVCEHFGLHALWEKIEKDYPTLPFKSDGCSMWLDDWKGFDLYPACFKHDLKYWAGYPGEDVARLIADAELMIDIACITGSTQMAELMFAGVRIGGEHSLKMPFSWGFGRKSTN